MSRTGTISIAFSLLLSAIAVPAMIILPTPASAQDYPSRPIILTVSTTPGASPDLIARLFGQRLSDALNTPVVIENKGGANGRIAVAAVARSAPDGYSFLATTTATLAANPSLYPKSGQIAVTDLVSVTKLVNQDFVITVRPSLKIRSMPELIAFARQNPGKLNVATTALGSSAYLTAELFKQAAGIDFLTIPHNGGGLAIGAVLGDHADVLVETVALSGPFIASGALIALATTGSQRSVFLPNAPTLKELGIAGCETVGWTGMVAPKGTPPAIIARVQSELARAAARDDIKRRLVELGSEPVVNTPEEFAHDLVQERAMWAAAIRRAGIKLE
jgi:tripartite-type tricarboxylate transporter receptor subunit TctC